ncbi:helix-turn-helix domain-containing protein [Yinghuangia soli]|uniref:Helix-turn-helix transcriptional regulator n=1 Tax=Yinghuangia soli TaxID=2908204 RepID=A0AA41U3I3_9ACTN|nr:helix-turn-helix transcriptional regulator [Yinghuangia soli]MCF2529742.1 helix-turn-helix transcriptional regulator [Yinghuangia soli]
MAVRSQKPGTEDHADLLAFLADEIRFRREKAGLSREQFGNLASIAATTVASYENGHRPLNAQFVFRTDEILDADGALTRPWERIVAHERGPDGFPWYIEMEKSASVIRTYESVLIPGLLQTREYARRLHATHRPAETDVQIERKVERRLARQEIFHRSPAVHLRFIIDEAAFRRIPREGGLAIEQLAHLLEMARLPNVSLGVISFADGFYPGLNGPFTLLAFDDGGESCYVPPAGRSAITVDRLRLAAFRETYDGLLAAALTQRQSEDLVREILETM